MPTTACGAARTSDRRPTTTRPRSPSATPSKRASPRAVNSDDPFCCAWPTKTGQMSMRIGMPTNRLGETRVGERNARNGEQDREGYLIKPFSKIPRQVVTGAGVDRLVKVARGSCRARLRSTMHRVDLRRGHHGKGCRSSAQSPFLRFSYANRSRRRDESKRERACVVGQAGCEPLTNESRLTAKTTYMAHTYCLRAG